MNQENLCKKHGLVKKELFKSIDDVLDGGRGNVSNVRHMMAIIELLAHGDIEEE